MGHVEVDELPISDQLKKNINLWNDAFQKTFNEKSPSMSGFKSREEELKHANDGKRIELYLTLELGQAYAIEFME